MTRLRLLLLVLLSSVLAVALSVPSSATPPPSPSFGPEIDPLSPNQPMQRCNPVEQPGTVAFRDMTLAAYPDTGNSGITRACNIRGASLHKEGRAWDWTVKAGVPAQRAMADEMIAWLLATDEHGNQFARLRRLGVMQIIWNRRIFTSSRAGEGFRSYPCNPNASFDDCHVRHVHFSFSRDGAAQRTSWWRAPAPAPAPTPAPGGNVSRLAGANRLLTSIAVSRQAFPSDATASHVFVANAGRYSDVVVAGALAGVFNGSLLLTGGGERLEPEIDAEVGRVLGAERSRSLWFVGGDEAIRSRAIAPYRSRYNVRHIDGRTRYATAALAARHADNHHHHGTGSAIVVPAEFGIDAVPMVAVAALNDWPIVLAKRDQLPRDTREFLAERNIEEVHIAGPPSVISASVKSAIGKVGRVERVERHFAENRYATAAAIAARFFPRPSNVALATGGNFPDGVLGGWYAGEKLSAPMLLTQADVFSGPAADYVRSRRTAGANGFLYGGTGAVSPPVEEAFRSALAP